MKIRTGFISNSSSSSFLIDATKYPKHKIEQYIKALLEAEDIIDGNATMQMYKTSFPGKVVEVHSIGDNSIPWPIQDALERIGRRDHWG
jgi:hypothetical protein